MDKRNQPIDPFKLDYTILSPYIKSDMPEEFRSLCPKTSVDELNCSLTEKVPLTEIIARRQESVHELNEDTDNSVVDIEDPTFHPT
jgi:hypothetical protein